MSQSAAIAETSADAGERRRAVPQFLTFVCAGEEYGVEILCVQEIKGWDGVTRVPYTPPYLLGVMNLRGVIVPVIDLRARFGLESRASTARPWSSSCAWTRRSARRPPASWSTRSRRSTTWPPMTSSRRRIWAPAPTRPACSGLTSVDDKMVMLLDIEPPGRLVHRSLGLPGRGLIPGSRS